MEKATFAAGCFWCIEAIFKKIKGVNSVISGFSGGEKRFPSYEDVVRGGTGHKEAVLITFDPKMVSFRDLVYIFFRSHDPTQVDGQGADIGEQYTSYIFYHNDRQKKIAEEEKKKAQKEYDKPIVTKLEQLKNFWKAEPYHQDYYSRNKDAKYCKVVIDPKIKKLEKSYKKFLKDED